VEFLVWLGTFLLMFLSFFMIVLILLQRGRGGGLAGAFGGMGSQSAFGTKAGDMFTRITVIVAIIWVVLAGGLGMAMRKVQGGKSQAVDLPSGTPKLEASDTGAQKPALGEGSSVPGSKPEITIPDLMNEDAKGSGPVLPKTGPVDPAAPAKTGDAPKPDAPKSEPAKPAEIKEGAAAKPDAPKGEPAKPEAPKDDTAKADPAKPEAPKAEEPKDAPKPEAKPEEPKPDAAKSEAEKPAESDKK
jgi:preprotein translocase subunit SecG